MTTKRDIIQIFLPDFVSLLSNISFIKDYGDWVNPSRESVLVAAASGYTFTDFITHAMPIVSVAVLVTLVMLR